MAGLVTGTVRFGTFGTARLYFGAQLVADVLARAPGVRVELVGQNSVAVQEDLRRGRLEAALIAIPVATERMTVTPVARDELVYVSADPEQLGKPVSVGALARADLVMAETSWRDVDSARGLLREALQRTGHTLQTRIEVEDVETAVEIVGLGLADSVLPRGAVEQLAPAAGTERRLGVPAAEDVRDDGRRASPGRRALTCRADGHRPGDPARAGHLRADRSPAT